ncbi:MULTISPECIES: PHB depolymerase family esterase [unclassified Streptomyces]|uniref:alpha/beta hydrolase family esterase n=1 Tax=unclassified Streptomyces TaxID=2593676 RepID=UPI0020351C82|nr:MULTISPECIES: PHB depolymerase family esterase [unclassified Streptomyces]
MPIPWSPSLRSPLTVAALCAALVLTACASEPKDSSAEGRPSKRPTSSSASPMAEVPRPGDQTVMLTWKGKQRTYKVHAPPGYTPAKKLPLVIAMHPYPSTGAYMEQLSGLSEKADQENFLVVYPDGHAQAFNALVCCGSEDDVGLLRTITDRFVDKWGADPARIYATGISNGGDMSLKAAVELHDVFAAVAPVSGGFIGSAAEDDSYRPDSPVSVITFVGELDRYYDSFDTGIKTWQKRVGCEVAPPEKVEKKVTRTTATCADGSEVTTYRLALMGHSWPSGLSDDMAFTESDVNATDLMWEFFAAHPKKRR